VLKDVYESFYENQYFYDDASDYFHTDLLNGDSIEVVKPRQHFPETWLWTSASAGYKLRLSFHTRQGYQYSLHVRLTNLFCGCAFQFQLRFHIKDRLQGRHSEIVARDKKICA